MTLTATELACLVSYGLYITQRCDGCGKLLNQTVRYTVSGKGDVYCSAGCRDMAFFGDALEAKKHSTPGSCAYCGDSLRGKNRGAKFCDGVCRKRFSRLKPCAIDGKQQKSRTPTQADQ